jgi:phytoene desaturase
VSRQNVAAGAGRPIAVVGAGLGGMSSAIHAALAGFEVTVYEANEQVGGRASRLVADGFAFDTGPSLLNYPWVFEQLFAAAGRRLSDYLELLPVDPSVHFYWRDGTTLALSSRLDRLIPECERLEPEAGRGVAAFLRDAGEKYRIAFDKLVATNADDPIRWLGRCSVRELMKVTVWRSLDRELGRFFRSRHLREALGAYAMYLGGSPFDLPGFFSILPYGEIAHGLWLPRGGIYGLVLAVERLCRDVGVRIHTSRRVASIETSAGRLRALRFADGSAEGRPVVISNVDVPTTRLSLLDPAHAYRKELPMTPSALTFYWGLRGSAEPLPHHAVFLPRDYAGAFRDLVHFGRIPEDLAFYTSVASSTDPLLAPPGCASMSVMVPLPLLSRLGRPDWPRLVDHIRSRVLERLGQHGAEGLRERITGEHVWTPVSWRDRFGLHDGSAFGLSHTLFHLGPMREKNYSRNVDGLYFVGASTTPGTGMPMVVLSGKLTVERILARVR